MGTKKLCMDDNRNTYICENNKKRGKIYLFYKGTIKQVKKSQDLFRKMLPESIHKPAH